MSPPKVSVAITTSSSSLGTNNVTTVTTLPASSSSGNLNSSGGEGLQNNVMRLSWGMEITLPSSPSQSMHEFYRFSDIKVPFSSPRLISKGMRRGL
jgi:hypothetical protein